MKIFSQSPMRISLFGGGTDIPVYSDAWGGVCLSMAINLRQQIILGGKNKLLKEDNPKFFEAFEIKEPIEHIADGHIHSGLGSSAALAVALQGAIAKRDGRPMNPNAIAEAAWNKEVKLAGLFGGKQDQYAASFGGVNVMEFTKKEVKVTPLNRDFIEPILPYLTLFYTGIKRTNPKIQEGLSVLSDEQVFHLTIVKNMCLQGIEAIANKDINKVADLMKQAWEAKKASNKGVTNEEIDTIYDSALSNGAIAGKLLGSGGGGHVLFMAQPEEKESFIKKEEAQGLKWVDFSIDWTGLDCRII